MPNVKSTATYAERLAAARKAAEEAETAAILADIIETHTPDRTLTIRPYSLDQVQDGKILRQTRIPASLSVRLRTVIVRTLADFLAECEEAAGPPREVCGAPAADAGEEESPAD